MSSIALDTITAQYAYHADRDDVEGLKRVAKRARHYAGEMTEHGKYADAAELRRVADTADKARHALELPHLMIINVTF